MYNQVGNFYWDVKCENLFLGILESKQTMKEKLDLGCDSKMNL